MVSRDGTVVRHYICHFISICQSWIPDNEVAGNSSLLSLALGMRSLRKTMQVAS